MTIEVVGQRVDAVVDLVPETCRRCAHRLHARDDEGDPRRHQVTEVPPIAAHITEYRCHRRHCPACGTRTVAAVPDECAGQFGPQLAALIAYLTVVCRLPRLVVQRLLADVLQIPLSLGSTQHAWEEASAAVAAPYKELGFNPVRNLPPRKSVNAGSAIPLEWEFTLGDGGPAFNSSDALPTVTITDSKGDLVGRICGRPWQ